MHTLKKSNVSKGRQKFRSEPSVGGISPLQLENMTWLGEVREVEHPINHLHPVTVRQDKVATGAAMQPSVLHPERHPYCELNYNFAGRGLQFIGNEKMEREPGGLMLMGPGTPHYGVRTTYPQHTATIHFLPILLFEMGPERDGARMLARFTAPQKIVDRIVKLPVPIARKCGGLFQDMLVEFEGRRMGSEFRLRALLMEILVELMRWEESIGRTFQSELGPQNWLHVEKILRFIHERYAEPIYVKQIARAVGLSVCRLQAVFRDALGMSCVQYLRAYRISRAAALLCNPEARVTEVALDAGFETLSHFNTSFRELMGMSPTEYIRSVR
jgi:AraC family transcriptional regulator, arabinose operon regulatory protein